MSMTNGVLTLLPAPEGYEVDFEHPQRQLGLALFLIYGIGVTLSVLFLCQHLYVKWRLQRRWAEPATVCLVATWVISLTCQSLVVSWFQNLMLGVHAWEMPLDRFILFLKSFTIVAVVFNVIHCLGKLSVLFSYHGLSPQAWWKWAVRAAMFLVVGYCTALFFALMFACTPVQKAWDITMTDGFCNDRQAIWLATAILGFMSDLILLSLPIHLVMGLRLGLPQKLGLMGMFVIGSATFVTSIVRLYYLLQPSFTLPDQTWEMMPTILWAMIELNLLVICPSMFTLRKFGTRIAPSIFGSSKGTKPSSENTPKSLRTFGRSYTSGRKYNQYGELFDQTADRDFDMTTLGCNEPTEVNVDGGGRRKSPSPSSDSTNAINKARDDHLKEAPGSKYHILQTKTVKVEGNHTSG